MGLQVNPFTPSVIRPKEVYGQTRVLSVEVLGVLCVRVSKKEGTLFWGPYNKGPTYILC